MAEPTTKRTLPPGWVGSASELEIALGISRSTLHRWRNLPSAPKKRRNGCYYVPEWEEFAKTVSVHVPIADERESTAEIRARNLRATILEREEILTAQQEAFVPVEANWQAITHMETESVRVFQSEITDVLPKLAARARDRAEVLKLCQDANDRFCRVMQEPLQGQDDEDERRDAELQQTSDLSELRRALLEVNTRTREFRVSVRRHEWVKMEEVSALMIDAMSAFRTTFDHITEQELPDRIEGKSEAEIRRICLEAQERFTAMVKHTAEHIRDGIRSMIGA